MGKDLIFVCMVKLTDCSSHKLLGIFELTMLYKLLSFSITPSSLLKFLHLSYPLLSALSFLMPGYACACYLNWLSLSRSLIYKSHVSTWLFNSCPRNKIYLPITIFVQSGGSQNLTFTFVIDQIFTIKLSKDPHVHA